MKINKHRNLNRSIFLIKCFVFILLTLGLSSCTKSDPTPVEEAITFTINPDPGSTIYAALGTTQDFSISITSKLPAAGVKIDLSLTKDLDGSTVFSQSLNSTLQNVTASFQNLASGVVCSGTIKIVSLTTSTNTSSKTFKIAKK
ncbi:MAG: hypothetical protein WCH78_05870 [Bacteroidota bacterium]